MQPQRQEPYVISFRVEHLVGWGITLALCMVPLFYWAKVNDPSFIKTMPSFMINAGRISGLIGMVMYALDLIYATRLRFLEYLFGGLNRVYIAHHILGGFALIFLSLHPLFLALRYVKTSLLQVALLLLPSGLAPFSALFNTSSPYHPQVLQQWATFAGIVAFWGMVGLLLITFFIQIPYRLWLMTHKFLGVFFIIGVVHVLFITSDTSHSMALRAYILTISALGIIAYIYRTFIAGKILVRHYTYTVSNVEPLPGGVLKISLFPYTPLRMSHEPGQFVFIRFLGVTDVGISQEWHPFSISSAPSDPTITVVVKSLGDYTRTLNRLPMGTVAEIEGAYGHFSYKKYKNKKQIWIAGGIGVTPFLSMAKSLPMAEGFNVDLYYSVRTASEVIDWPMLYNTAVARGGTFRIIPYISDQQPGHLSADYIEQISGSVKDRDIYICGPPAMMNSLRKQFKAKAVPGTSIHTEEFAMT